MIPFLALSAGQSRAADFSSVASGNYNENATWGGVANPANGVADNVTINANTVTLSVPTDAAQDTLLFNSSSAIFRVAADAANIFQLSALDLTGSSQTIQVDRLNSATDGAGQALTASTIAFGGGRTLTLTRGSNITAGAVALTLSGAATVTGTQTFSIANPTSTTGTLVLGGTLSGSGTISKTGTGTLIITSDNTAHTGNYSFASGATVIAFAGATQAISGTVSSSGTAGALVKTGTGQLTLSGSNGSFTSTINGGELVLDYGVNDNSKLGDAANFAMRGGTVTMSGTSSHVEVVGSTTIANGLTNVRRAVGNSSVLELNTISFTAAGAGTVNFAEAGIATTNSTNTNGILSSRALVGGADWAVNSTSAADGPITAYTGYVDFATATTSASNALLTGTGSTGAKSAYTVKINTTGSGQSLTLSGALTLGSGSSTGGLLFVGADDYTITGGNIFSVNTSSLETVFHHYGTGVLTINSPVTNRAGSSAFTFSGTGTYVLGGTNTYRGQTSINGAKVSISSNANLGDPVTGAAVNLSGGTLRATADFGLFNGTAGVNNRPVILHGGGGTVEVTGANTLTIPGVISDSTASTTVGKLTKSGTGTLVLSGVNTYTGGTIVSGGTLLVNGSLSDRSAVAVQGGILGGSGSVGAISLESGSLAPRNGLNDIGNFSAIALNWSGGSMAFDLSASDNTSDRLTLTDSFGGSGGSYVFNLSGGMEGQTYTLVLFGSTTFLSGSQFSATGAAGFFTLNSGSLTFTAIPEPSTYALALGGLLLVLTGSRVLRRTAMSGRS